MKRLNQSHNSLKAHVLYHRLVHDRALGIYDKERFMTYIALPKSVFYVNNDYINRRGLKGYWADLNQDYYNITFLKIIGNDEPQVRSYLEHFFDGEDSYKLYETYINDIYLKELFAETKIVNGIGDMETWYSWLPPAKYQALKGRRYCQVVKIVLADHNKAGDSHHLFWYVAKTKLFLLS